MLLARLLHGIGASPDARAPQPSSPVAASTRRLQRPSRLSTFYRYDRLLASHFGDEGCDRYLGGPPPYPPRGLVAAGGFKNVSLVFTPAAKIRLFGSLALGGGSAYPMRGSTALFFVAALAATAAGKPRPRSRSPSSIPTTLCRTRSCSAARGRYRKSTRMLAHRSARSGRPPPRTRVSSRGACWV